MSEFRKQFLARLLLVAAQAAGSHQGSTNRTSSDVYMTGRSPLTRWVAENHVVDLLLPIL